MKVISFPFKHKAALLCEFQDALNQVCNESRFDELTVTERIGMMEMFKWELISNVPDRDEE